MKQKSFPIDEKHGDCMQGASICRMFDPQSGDLAYLAYSFDASGPSIGLVVMP
jgi:hypothetical protein